MSLEALTEISRFYGRNGDFVLAGGGNTSWKDGDTLYVKGSGMALADVTPDSFVRMDRRALAAIWEKKYPQESDERESAVLADMMAARKAGEERKRPSVEALLHDILPFNYVAHLHPALVNGLTCSQRGEAAMAEIFGDEAIWIPSTNPGYVLSGKVREAMNAYIAKNGGPALVIFLQNHGVFVGDNGVDGIKEIYGEIMHKIGAWVKRRPNFSDEDRQNLDSSADPVNKIIMELKELAGGSAIFMRCGEIAPLVKDRESFAPVASAFSPDHIVYAGSDPLFAESETVFPEGAFCEAALQKAWKDHVEKTGLKPKITAIQGMGVFGAAATEKAAGLALDLFRDAVRVSVYSESFGGPLFMTRDKIDFINNWEVERFRTNVST